MLEIDEALHQLHERASSGQLQEVARVIGACFASRDVNALDEFRDRLIQLIHRVDANTAPGMLFFCLYAQLESYFAALEPTSKAATRLQKIAAEVSQDPLMTQIVKLLRTSECSEHEIWDGVYTKKTSGGDPLIHLWLARAAISLQRHNLIQYRQGKEGQGAIFSLTDYGCKLHDTHLVNL